MKGLTIKQPWAYAILHLGKRVENRDWDTNIRGRIALHTSKTVRKSEFAMSVQAIATMYGERGHVPRQEELPHGMIVAVADIVDCVTDMNSPWFVGDYGFVLANIIELSTPIPATGALGFWDVPKGIEEKINDQIS